MENLILGKIGTGKTTKLIQLAADNNFTIITHCGQAVSILLKVAKDMNLSIPTPISYNDFEKGNFSENKIKGLLLDDVDEFLHRKSKGLMKGLSITISKDVIIL